jgi:VanZ family protein
LENKKLNKRLALPLFWTILIFYFSLKPSNPNSSSFLNIEGMDKVIHFSCYLALAISWLFFLNPVKGHKQVYSYTFILISLLGILIEILQDHMNLGREYDPNDMIANALGALVGIILYRKYSVSVLNWLFP